MPFGKTPLYGVRRAADRVGVNALRDQTRFGLVDALWLICVWAPNDNAACQGAASPQSWHQLQAPAQLPAEADSSTISFIIIASSPILFTPYILIVLD